MIDWIRRMRYRRHPAESSRGLDELLAQSHDGLGTFDMEGTEVPLILLREDRFQKMISRHMSPDTGTEDTSNPSHGSSVKTNLNILRDGMGHVFVDIVMTFGDGEKEIVTVNANEHLDFFQKLAETTVLAIAPARPDDPRIFMIQLPRAESAEEALRMIEAGLASGDKR